MIALATAAASAYTGRMVPEPSELERRVAVLEAIVDARLAYLGPAAPGQVLTCTLAAEVPTADAADALMAELAEVREAIGADRVVVLIDNQARLNLA